MAFLGPHDVFGALAAEMFELHGMPHVHICFALLYGEFVAAGQTALYTKSLC